MTVRARRFELVTKALADPRRVAVLEAIAGELDHFMTFVFSRVLT